MGPGERVRVGADIASLSVVQAKFLRVTVTSYFYLQLDVYRGSMPRNPYWIYRYFFYRILGIFFKKFDFIQDINTVN